METNNELRDMLIAQAKFTLKQAGYFVDNLWHVDDVKGRFECDDDLAQSILYDALTNEYIVEKVFDQISDFAECENLKSIED